MSKAYVLSEELKNEKKPDNGTFLVDLLSEGHNTKSQEKNKTDTCDVETSPLAETKNNLHDNAKVVELLKEVCERSVQNCHTTGVISISDKCKYKNALTFDDNGKNVICQADDEDEVLCSKKPRLDASLSRETAYYNNENCTHQHMFASEPLTEWNVNISEKQTEELNVKQYIHVDIPKVNSALGTLKEMENWFNDLDSLKSSVLTVSCQGDKDCGDNVISCQEDSVSFSNMAPTEKTPSVVSHQDLADNMASAEKAPPVVSRQDGTGSCSNIASTHADDKDQDKSMCLQLLENTVNNPKMSSAVPKVCYIYSPDYIKCCDTYGKVKMRGEMTHALIEAYRLLESMSTVTPHPATIQEISVFHSVDYIETLKKISVSDDPEKYDDDAEQYGLGYDCPVDEGIFDYAAYVAGASIKAAECVNNDHCQVAINWPGGWHHAKRDEASGFCYFNDVVLSILKLREKFDRVLYIDIDLHHGDGVEDAFCATSKVFTLSFHKYAPGFFPGTGSLNDVGMSRGKFYCCNVPLKDGIQDQQYFEIFTKVTAKVITFFQPQSVVCQCGADGLVGDPMTSFNLTPSGILKCIRHILNWSLPTVLLGGGGYNKANTSRCWTSITGEILGIALSEDIPEHKYFTQYGPDYELGLSPGNRSNENSDHYIQQILSELLKNLENVPGES